ncbi:asparagine synthetase B [Clostridia bacterium]|nr:asparagine synthetase B [Clostridia bacterium]
MCGLVGFSDCDTSYDKAAVVRDMAELIRHRGPDSDGFFTNESVSLGFRRLSIIDLDGGSQPIYNEDENLLIFFNGEIYNFQEIRADLTAAGHIFKTNADTETVLHGYEEYGEEICAKLRGMFAFIIYDKAAGSFFGARDMFGIKPLYYYSDEDNRGLFIFGSEIKSFLAHPRFRKELNREALKTYLTFQYNPLEETFFKNVFRLPQGTYFTYRDGKMKITPYFDADYTDGTCSFEEYAKLIGETVQSSVKYHQISDVEVGSFLSGGVDSSFIASEAKPDKTFSVGFAVDGFDESMYAKELSDILHIKNFKKTVSSDEFFAALPNVQYHSDEPHANLSAVPLYYLSKMAAESVKVVLSGEGADELFAGYIPFAEGKFARVYKHIPFGCRKIIAGIAKKLPNFKGRATLVKYGTKVEDYYIGQAFIMGDDDANALLTEPYRTYRSFRDVTAPYFEKVRGKSDLIKKLYLDLKLWLPNDILLKADKMTMSHSLELRVPFLDREVMKLASEIPVKYLVKGRETKRVFREAANKAVPPEWAKREKVGFPVPFTHWLRDEKYCANLREIFAEKFTAEFFNVGKLTELLDAHVSGRANNGRKLYTVYSFLLWYKVYFIESDRVRKEL